MMFLQYNKDTDATITVDMDDLDLLHLQGQQCHPAIRYSLLRWSCRERFLPWHAVHHRLMVS